MIDVNRYNQLKVQVEKHQTEANKAQGALEQLMEQLRKEYGFASLKDAKTQAAKYDTQAQEAEEEYNKALAAFEEEWGDQFNDSTA